MGRGKSLPKGVRYEFENIDNVRSGLEEPRVKFIYNGFEISYNLDKGQRVREYSSGEISNEIIENIDQYVYSHLNQIKQQYRLHKVVYFSQTSKCYYDFDEANLYNASGVKGKNKTKIKAGEVCPVRGMPKIILEALTSAKNRIFSRDMILEITGSVATDRAVDNHIVTLRRLDPVIENTIDGEYGVGYKYTGEIPKWIIIENGAEKRQTSHSRLSLRDIFLCVYSNNFRIIDISFDGYKVKKYSDLSTKEMFQCIVPKRIIDELKLQEDAVQKCFEGKYGSNPECLIKFYQKGISLFQQMWDEMYCYIEKRLMTSRSAQLYYNDYNELPETIEDIEDYETNAKRLNPILKRLCSSTEKLISETTAYDFFSKCKVDVNEENVLDYIIALWMISISELEILCRCVNSEVNRAYKRKIREFLERKFPQDVTGGNSGENSEDIFLIDMNELERAFRERFRYEYNRDVPDDVIKIASNTFITVLEKSNPGKMITFSPNVPVQDSPQKSR